MGKFVIRVPRTNCKEGPWDYTDEKGKSVRGSMVDAANSYTRRLIGLGMDSPTVTHSSVEYKYPRWRRNDKRQSRHGTKGKITVVIETED